MQRVLVFVITLIVLIGIGACVEPIPVDDPTPSDPIVVVSVSASDDDGNVAENTLDDDLSTRWSAHGQGQYITFEFNDTVRLGSVGIAWYLGDERHWTYEILISLDGSQWTQRVSSTSDLTLEYQDDALDADTRFVRIVGYGNNQSSWNSITGVRFNGLEAVYAPAPDLEPAPSPGPNVRESMSLRGDPDFDPSSLSDSQFARFESIKEQMASPRYYHQDPYVMADRGDSWWYGHYLQTYVQSILLVFRMTGDLELLDHVYELGELMQSHLEDAWHDTKDGTDGTTDGYRNWVMTMSGGGDHNYGKDTHINYEMRSHAAAALIAYALDANRDLQSPSGYDYGAQADGWEDYLVNDFEAKWRERKGTTDASFPIFPRHDPPYYSGGFHWMQWHYYMGELTGNDEYTQYAGYLADERLERLVPCANEDGDAYVWLRSEPSWYGAGTVYGDYLAGATYEEMTMASAVDLHFEGFDFVADPTYLERWGHTFTGYVIDTADPMTNGFARSVGGEQDRCGLPYEQSNYRRMTKYDYFRMSWSHLAPWDGSGEILELTKAMEAEGTRLDRSTIRSLASLMLEEYLRTS